MKQSRKPKRGYYMLGSLGDVKDHVGKSRFMSVGEMNDQKDKPRQITTIKTGGMTMLKFTLSKDAAQIVLNALAKEPYVQVVDVINNIQQQAAAQLQQQKDEASAE